MEGNVISKNWEGVHINSGSVIGNAITHNEFLGITAGSPQWDLATTHFGSITAPAFLQVVARLRLAAEQRFTRTPARQTASEISYRSEAESDNEESLPWRASAVS